MTVFVLELPTVSNKSWKLYYHHFFWPIKLNLTISYWFPNICFHLKKKKVLSLFFHIIFSTYFNISFLFASYLFAYPKSFLWGCFIHFSSALRLPTMWPFPFDSGTQFLYIISHFTPFNVDYLPANKAGRSICPYDKYLVYIHSACRIELCPLKKCK